LPQHLKCQAAPGEHEVEKLSQWQRVVVMFVGIRSIRKQKNIRFYIAHCRSFETLLCRQRFLILPHSTIFRDLVFAARSVVLDDESFVIVLTVSRSGRVQDCPLGRKWVNTRVTPVVAKPDQGSTELQIGGKCSHEFIG